MSKINIEILGRDAEQVSYTQDGEPMLVLEFTEELDGYVALGSTTARIKGSQCTLNIRQLSDGEYIPHLILENKTIDLPRIALSCGIITPTEPQIPYTTRLSTRVKQLTRRLDGLEKRLDEITKRIVGNGIFNTQP